MITASHTYGQDIIISLDKNALKALPQVANDSRLSNDANWATVAVTFKHSASTKRLTCGFVNRNNSITSPQKVKTKGTSPGQIYQIESITITSKSTPLPIKRITIKRASLSNPSSMDFTVKGPPLTVEISTSQMSVTGSQKIRVYVTFSHHVTGFNLSDVYVSGGAVAYSLSGALNIYNFFVDPAPAGEGNFTIRINANSASTSYGELNSASNELWPLYIP